MTDSQNNQILDHLRKGGDISPIEALELFGCFRLAARIADLKERGHNIETIMQKANGKRWARYRMARGSQLELV